MSKPEKTRRPPTDTIRCSQTTADMVVQLASKQKLSTAEFLEAIGFDRQIRKLYADMIAAEHQRLSLEAEPTARARRKSS